MPAPSVAALFHHIFGDAVGVSASEAVASLRASASRSRSVSDRRREGHGLSRIALRRKTFCVTDYRIIST